MIQVIAVQSKKQLKQFIMLPFRLYRNDSCWVAPLIGEQKKFFDPRHNPFYEHSEAQLFVAVENDRVVGRISAHTNTEHNKEHNDNCGFFGFFESEDRMDVARALFDQAYRWNRERGRDTLRGPLNFTVNDEAGLLIDGFETSPYVMMTHNPPYYQNLYESNGMVKAMDMYAYYSDHKVIPERVDRAAQLIQKRYGHQIRHLDKHNLKRDIETVFEIYTKAWEYNWGYVPMTKAEFDHTVQMLLPLVDPQLVLIAEVDGKPAGFSLAMPNYNEVLKVMKGRINPVTIIKALLAKRRITSARVVTMGVIREYQNRGIDTLFYYHSYKYGLPKGYYKAEFSWVLENNTRMMQVAEMLGATPYKTYRIYDQAIV
ncbi:MAG: GNAT family N-acetyltransferase [Candidatus Cloacimonetes bacterium]|nr:GNAT family N-acetyltransferase [Candidatus Cloacimonadota bacterium]